MPHAHAAHVSLRVHVITVSTSRGPADDRSGPLLRQLATGAGHEIAGHAIVADDPDEIGGELDRALFSPTIDVVLLTGGTGISARDCTASVVRSRLDRELPGFGELFRMLSFQDVGSAAMLSSAVGGLSRGRVVFALPGSVGACQLAMEKLILPELGHLAGELKKESPLPRKSGEVVKPVVRSRVSTGGLPAAAAPAVDESLDSAEALSPPRKGIDITPAPDAERPPEIERPGGWQAAVRAVDGKVVPVGGMEIPDALARIPAVMDVLQSASSRMKLVAADGREWMLFGYPDFARPSSKVIAVREALPISEVVALHRWPVQVGVCIEGDDSLLPNNAAVVGKIAEQRTGKAYEGDGQLFAVDAAAVYVQERRWVRKWDGKKLGPEDNIGAALGTMLLNWSQR